MESIWRETTEIGKRKSLPGDMTVDTAVIGAGMAGCLIAWYLRQRGIQTVVLEENRIGGGQTENTTAKITCQHDLIYDRLIRLFGAENARRYAKANLSAISEYQRLIEEKGITCDFSMQPAYLYSLERTDRLELEAQAARHLGIDAVFTTDTGLPFPVKGAIRFERQAQFHPLKFLRELSGELEIYEHTRVISIERGDRAGQEGRSFPHWQRYESRLLTDHGTVTAAHVVFATHFPFINFPGWYFARMHQERSYVIALEKAELPEGIYLGTDSDGISLRRAGDRVLLGGGSHRTGKNRDGEKYDALSRKAGQWFPGAAETARWSAQDCMTMDGVPYIGRFSVLRPDWYVVTGFGKWGMTSSMVAAMVISDLICGVENVYAPVFSPQRFRLKASAGNLLKNLGESALGLAKGLFSFSGTDKIGTRRCPHLGCRLEWNPDERTWECPCHGSCFGPEGEKLEGPAQKDISDSRAERP